MASDLVKTSKFLSRVLRHEPELIGLSLDQAGWAAVDELLTKANQSGRALTLEVLQQVVEQNDKQRFAFSDDDRLIRANQGHSISVDLGLEPLVPPDVLYHGTATRFADSIKRRGLLAGRRNYVHLSLDQATAIKVGRRHGRPVVLIVLAGQMNGAGFTFYRSANGIWLTEKVPVEYLVFPQG